MKICITGGAGYIGSVLVPELQGQGHDVVVFDKLLFGRKIDAEVVEGDVRDTAAFERAARGSDCVIHLAALVGEPMCDMDKDSAININFIGAKNIAASCKRMGIRMIFASTCSVYGAQPETMLTEDSDVAPLSIYGVAKVAAEDSIMGMADADFRPTVFRMGTIHGYSPRMRFDLVINLFVAKALQEGAISVYGGNQWRPFIHIKDVADAYARAVRSDSGGVFNLGGRNHTILDISDTVGKALGCKVNVIKEVKDNRNYMVSSAKAEKEFGVEFKRDVQTTIDEVKAAYERGEVKDYGAVAYSNLKSILQDEDVKRKIKNV
jgi:nucleoside-diphosphate-sugar epimerase